MTHRTQWTAPEGEIVRSGVSNGLSAAEIAEDLPGRTRNAVIGYCHRNGLSLDHISRPVEPARQAKRTIKRLYNEGVRCKHANQGCRDPFAKLITRSSGDQCGFPGCDCNRIPHALHGLCHRHNAERLSLRQRRNTGVEVVTSGYAG